MSIQNALDGLCQALAEQHASHDLRFTFPPEAWDALDRELRAKYRMTRIGPEKVIPAAGDSIVYNSQVGTVVITRGEKP